MDKKIQEQVLETSLQQVGSFSNKEAINNVK
jgi:hypothetical protein